MTRVIRVLLLSTTTGYQLRSFNERPRELGIELVFATDRCHQLDDPWRDRAIPVRFHEEDASLEAIVARRAARAVSRRARGRRPARRPGRARGRALGLPGHPPDAARRQQQQARDPAPPRGGRP